MSRLFATSAIAITLAANASAEIYLGIGPLDTLADVKLLFPAAKVERRQPAWAQPTDAMFAFAGSGISGEIVVKFYDGRPMYLKASETEQDLERREMYKTWANASDDEALTVEWVRWIPSEPIPLKRFVAKYGEPDESGFRDDNMRPFRQWKRGILANLDDDMKLVTDVEFTFTPADERSAWQQKHGFVPEHLKEASAEENETSNVVEEAVLLAERRAHVSTDCSRVPSARRAPFGGLRFSRLVRRRGG